MNNFEITKDTLHQLLIDVSKEFRKLNGKKTPAEIVLVGGAAILTGYGFRQATTDIDAIIRASSAMKQAINNVSDKQNLPNGWLNTDFVKSSSYTPKLLLYSRPYHTFSNILQVRIVAGEYLVAMKLKAGRDYKYDMSDVIGIMAEHRKKKMPLEYEDVDKAVYDLYGGWEQIPEESKTLFHLILSSINLRELYDEYRKLEISNKAIMVEEWKEQEEEKTANKEELIKLAKEKLEEKK
ncbi:MAG: DUF6036 family nucleotidyltransferase [Anaerovoracaceae bacterium]